RGGGRNRGGPGQEGPQGQGRGRSEGQETAQEKGAAADVRPLGRVRRRHETGGHVRLQPEGGRGAEDRGVEGQEKRGVLPADCEGADARTGAGGRNRLIPTLEWVRIPGWTVCRSIVQRTWVRPPGVGAEFFDQVGFPGISG